jgi:hypothetical protein
MKTRKTSKTLQTIFFVLFLLPMITFAGKGKNKKATGLNSCLEISGKVATDNKKSNGLVSVLLFKNNMVVQSIKMPPTGTFKFILDKNEEYTVKIVQKGFFPRLISISTEIPEKIIGKHIFKFYFDLVPLPNVEVATKNTDALDFPVALVFYDKEKGYFDYSKKYTEFIKERISDNRNID